MKYAKVFASEKVGRSMVEFVDPVIYKYMAEEFCEAVSDLDQVRKQLQLENECCGQVLQGSSFLHAIINWQGSSDSNEQFNFLPKPQSVNDVSVARIQLADLNRDLLSIIRAYVQSIQTVRRYKEQMATMAYNDPSRHTIQILADTEAGSVEHKLEQVRKHHAQWCPDMQLFCEAWF